MKQKINNLLELYTGYRFQKTATSFFKQNKARKTKPIYIEFIGTSGTGKTTLFNKMIQKSSAKFISHKEYLNLFYSQYFNLKLNELELYQTLGEIAVEGISLNMGYKGTSKLSRISYLQNIFKFDALVKQYNTCYTIMNDDGLLHNGSSYIKELAEKDKQVFLELIKNRAFIYCYVDTNTNFTRIFERYHKTGFLSPYFQGYTSNELLKIIEHDYKQINEYKEFLKYHGMKIIEINTLHDHKENIQKIDLFISDLQNS